jgi:hydroxymethylpyrimidine pyrophosphatase-like HAD family hydrolase
VLIALDYDGTYTEDSDLWREFITQARGRGHRVVCVTMRYEHESEQVVRQLAGRVDHIIFTGRRAKKPHMELLGLVPDVWIEDAPHWVFTDAEP